MDEGYIKFNCQWITGDPVPFDGFAEINSWRERLHQLGLIGMNSNKIGFGNISLRVPGTPQFYVTGSATGGIEKLTEAHYTRVIDFDIKENRLTCKGPIKASSESLSHAAVYFAAPEINVVMHIHHRKSWELLINHLPTTGNTAAYGTPEMHLEIIRLFKETDLRKKQVLVMAGHPEGIISFGRNMEEAGNFLLKYLKI
ncbi:MAG TPA: class II aldolase/adducin family protein [Bacillota bacterium]|nr:class II aldolase/adducin family protein [Bacillota bacterium]